MEIKLNGQVAIVTCFRSGIGEGIVKCLAASGAIVIVNHSSEHSKEAAQIILDDIFVKGEQGMLSQCDVNKEVEV
ncbi:hypothetical protein [Soonwooa sp.]|uniref:hypothetical protein n=1 Tax=Soonwooa sp. TaxID=1938592 RepID=UPI0028A190A3|nr:hypothetical protein [Soonwooa sp.]